MRREALRAGTEIPPAYYSPVWGPTLYLVVRSLRPRTIVETGVAHGVSTAHILTALFANGEGVLHSMDKRSRASYPNGLDGPEIATRIHAVLVPRSMRTHPNGRWVFHDELITEATLDRLMARTGQIDVFIHDSDHSPEHVYRELKTAWRHLSPTGVLIVDDIVPDDSGLARFLAEIPSDEITTLKIGPVAIVRRCLVPSKVS